MKTKMTSYVLEPSTNTHTVVGGVAKATEYANSNVAITTSEESLITHGEHGTLVVPGKRAFFKSVQHEYNPVTKKMMLAAD